LSNIVTKSDGRWFVETSFPGIRRCKQDSFRIEKEIYKGKSPYQDIYIFESLGFGKMLSLDGIIQFSQSDEFIYHEIIAHVPLFSHSNPRRFLVVGGGDGGVLREAARHPLKELYQVEIDKEIVDVSKRYLPFVSKGVFADKRLSIAFEDGKRFMKRYKNYFDIIVVDSTDPVGPGKVLFQGDFYHMVQSALTTEGIAIFQLGPFLDFDLIIRPTGKKLQSLFKHVVPVRLPMPSYSCGCEYCFVIASKAVNPATVPLSVLKKRLAARLRHNAANLKYYTPQLHQASMVMPRKWQL
jgi:spermidine synthase